MLVCDCVCVRERGGKREREWGGGGGGGNPQFFLALQHMFVRNVKTVMNGDLNLQ